MDRFHTEIRKAEADEAVTMAKGRIAERTEAELMYPYREDIDVGRYIVHGHTTVAGVPVPGRNRINVDTGACVGGSLSAAAFVRGKRLRVAIVSDDLVVESEETWIPPFPRLPTGGHRFFCRGYLGTWISPEAAVNGVTARARGARRPETGRSRVLRVFGRD